MAAFESMVKLFEDRTPLTEGSAHSLANHARKEQEVLYAKIKKYEAKRLVQIKIIDADAATVNAWLIANQDKTIVSVTTTAQWVITDREFYYATTIVYEEIAE